MVEKNASFISAANYVRKKRPVIFPNIGFQRQLLHVEEMLKKNKFDQKDNVSVKSKTRKTIRSAKQNTRSETRSNYGGSTASVYRGKYADKYKLRSSVKVQKSTSMNKNRGYKEKAKDYYLGLKNNWVGDTKINIKNNKDPKNNTMNIGTNLIQKINNEFQVKSAHEKDQKATISSQDDLKRLSKRHYKHPEPKQNNFSPKQSK